MNYKEFAHEACQKLIPKQNQFRAEFNLDDYSSWFYTQASEVLRLYNDDKEIFFRYIPVGSFSRNSNTWLWSWANSNSVEPRKFEMLQLKELGEALNYEELYTGHIEGDKFTGWALTSIAFEKLGGIGTYRVISDHLEIYFLLTDQISKSKVEELEKDLVECDYHGKMRSAFICQHLNGKTKTGFEEAFESHKGMPLHEDDDFQAWCDSCEKERLRTNGWTDESMEFAKVRVVCEGCYFAIKDFNLS